MAVSPNMLAILAMCAAMAGYITNDMFIKLVSSSMPTGEIMAIRGVLATAIILAVVRVRGGSSTIGAAHWAVGLRTLTEVGATELYLTALFLLPIADATAIIQSMPLVITLLSVVVLREVVGIRRWSAVIVGFVGMLLIVRPGAGDFNPASVFAVLAVVLMAARDIMSRFVPATLSAETITIITSAAVTATGFAMAPFEIWVWPEWREMFFLACAALFILCGYSFIFVAARAGDLSAAAPFRYSILIWALAYGFFIWGEVPDAVAFAGIALIVASGLYVFYREQWHAEQNGR